MLKRVIVLVIFILTFTASYSQEYVDVVYLKNGNIVRGIIFSQDFKEYVKIMSGENVWVFKMDEILKIVKEVVVPRGNSKDTSHYQNNFNRYFFGQLQFGITPFYLPARMEIATKSLRVDIKGGYQLNRALALTAGTGFRYLNTDINIAGAGLYKYRTAVPILLGLRLRVGKKKLSFYSDSRAGYSWDARQNFSRLGPLINQDVGIAVKISEKHSLNVGVGAEVYLFNNPDGDMMIDGAQPKYENLTLTFGVTF